MNSISIIIPVYNEGILINDFINHIRKKCIDNNNNDIEIIVVDADKKGSTIKKINGQVSH